MKRSQAPSRSEKLFAVEAAYGRAMLRAHGIEHTLATWLICAACQQHQGPSRQKEISAIKRLPLGKLIERFVVEATVPDTLAEELGLLLSIRNDIAHRIAEKFSDAARNMNWERLAIDELSSASESLAKCRSALQPYMAQAREMAGVTEAEVNDVIAREFPGAGVDA